MRNDPEHPLPEFTGQSIGKAPDKWSYGPEKKDRERLLRGAWNALGQLRAQRVTVVEVIRGYHLRGIMPLRRRALALWQMMPDKAPFEGTVTADPLPSAEEVKRRVAAAVGRDMPRFSPSRALPMLSDARTRALVSVLLLPFLICFDLSCSASPYFVFSR